MIILLFFICMHLYAVDTELTLPGLNIDYNQVLLQRNNALQELHPEGYYCCNTIPRRYGCLTLYDRDAAHRLFPPEQDTPNFSRENCYASMRRSGISMEHPTYCFWCSSIGCFTVYSMAPCVWSFWPWQVTLTTTLVASFMAITALPTFGCVKDKTREDDAEISLSRIRRMYPVPLLELDELDESDPTLQTPTYAAIGDD